jgi:hypothetical protein
MIYYIEKNSNRNIVVITGTKHTLNYQDFFENTSFSKRFRKEWECDKAWDTLLSNSDKKQKRCMQIPVNIIKELITFKS